MYFLPLAPSSSTREGATCKTYPCGREACFTILPGENGAEAHKEKGGKKKEEEKPAIKGRMASEERGGVRGEGGRVYVTFDRARKHNIKVVRAARGRDAWRDANPVFHSS